MYRAGQEEIDAVAALIRSKQLFRYQEGSQCQRFEKRYAEFLGVKHVMMCSSGTAALVAGLAALGIGPGDEVLVPAHTYMATAVAVLGVGAIPIIVDIDATITLSPEAMEAAIGPRTRAVIPVHMWGGTCDMNRIMRIAEKRKLLVLEDACQCVGGGYEGRKIGSIGHAGAFSFNYFKNMTCGEGGAIVTNDDRAAQAARCNIDCCGFFWTGKEADIQPFSSAGSRASEIEGALMNVQLDRIDAMLSAMRGQKERILRATAGISGLKHNPINSPDYDCSSQTLFMLPTPENAIEFAKLTGGTVAGKTGRHTYNEWDPILNHRVGHHPALNPYTWDVNKPCRKDYSQDMCAKSLEILNRTVMVANHPDRTEAEVDALIEKMSAVAKSGLG